MTPPPEDMTAMPELSYEEWAIICTIKQEAQYRFTGPELQAAKAMEARGLLHSQDGGRFSVSRTGETAYSQSGNS